MNSFNARRRCTWRGSAPWASGALALWAALILVLAAGSPALLQAVAAEEGDDAPSPAGHASSGSRSTGVIATVAMPSGETNFQAAALDPVAGYALFGTSASPGEVVKVRVGAANEAPTRVGSLVLEAGENDLLSGVMDPSTGYAYFGTNTGRGRVIKVDLEDGDIAPRRVGMLEFDGAGGYLRSAVIDPPGGHAYFGSGLSTGRVVKVGLGAGDALPTQVGAATFPSGSGGPVSAVIDPMRGHAYFGTSASPGRVVKVALGAGSQPPTIVGVTTLPAGHDDLSSAMIDVEGGLLYFVSQTSPGLVAKLSVGADNAAPVFLSSTVLESGGMVAESPRVALADEMGQLGLIATFTQPAKLVSLDLSGSTPVVSGIVALDADNSEILARCGVHDPITGRALIGTRTLPARVIKVDPGFSAPEPIEGLPTGEYEVRHVSAIARTRAEVVLGSSDVSTTPRICADGSDVTVFRIAFDVTNPDPAAYGMELVGPGGEALDPAMGGSFAVEPPALKSQLQFRHTHPEDFGATGVARAATARVVHAATGQVLLEIPVEIHRAPVLMLHGLWGDASGFEAMEARLLGLSSPPPTPTDSGLRWAEVRIAADGAWPGEGRFQFVKNGPAGAGGASYELRRLVADSPLLLRHEYPNEASFESNRTVVRTGAQALLEKAVRARYSAGKVDVVAHSMGGVLTRVSLQRDGGTRFVRSLITLDTPHWGSQFANWLQGRTVGSSNLENMGLVFLARVFGAVGSFKSDGVRDLRVSRRSVDPERLDSTGLDEGLGSEPVVPSHFVGVEDPGGLTSTALLALLTVPAAYDGYLLPPNASNLVNDIFGQDPHDQVVALPSQLGGLDDQHPATRVFPGFHHVGVQAEESVIDHVETLLLGSRDDAAWTARVQPRPIDFAYDFSIGVGGVGARRAGTEIVGGLQVSLPNGEGSVPAGSTVVVRVASSHGFASATLLALTGGEVVSTDVTLPADTPIIVPADAVENLVITALATNAAGEFSAAALEVPVIPSSNPVAVTVSWPEQIFLPVGAKAYYTPRVVYGAGGQVLLSPSDGGAVEVADPALADLTEWGVITALAEGETTVTVSLGPLEASTVLTVLPADGWDPPSVSGWQVE